MTTQILLFFCVLCFILVDVGHCEAQAEGQVTAFTGATLGDVLTGVNPVVVHFMVNWCTHCQTFQSKFKKVSEFFATRVTMGTLDCTLNSVACDQYQIKAFPTIILFKDQVPHVYTGQRTATAMKEFIQRFLEDAFPVFESQGPLQGWMEGNDVSVVGHFNSAEHHDFIQFWEYAKLAQGNTAIAIAALINPGVQEHKVSITKNFDERFMEIKAPFSVQLLQRFVEDNTVQLVHEVGPWSYSKFVGERTPGAYLFLDLADVQGEAVVIQFARIARLRIGSIRFLFLDGPSNHTLAQQMGLSARKWPALVVEDDLARTYVMDEGIPLTFDTMQQFLIDFNEGRLTSFLRTEAPPPKVDHRRGSIQVVVGSTFRSMVIDAPLDVLIHIYAPWCGFCKVLHPIFATLAQWLRNVPTIRVVEMDGTLNSVPLPLQVTGYPTIYLKTASGEISEYVGPRTADAMATFILDRVSHHIDPLVLNYDDRLDENSDTCDCGGTDGAADGNMKSKLEAMVTQLEEQARLIKTLQQTVHNLQPSAPSDV